MHEHYLRQTFQLAKQSVRKGNHPFGALLVLNDEVVATAENTVNTSGDVTRHAELNLISEFIGNFSMEERKQIILYTSTEPCAMCTGAIVWSGIQQIVYGCSSRLLNDIAKGTFTMECRTILENSSIKFEVVGPILEEEASLLHTGYWP